MNFPSDRYLKRFNEGASQRIFENTIDSWLIREGIITNDLSLELYAGSQDLPRTVCKISEKARCIRQATHRNTA